MATGGNPKAEYSGALSSEAADYGLSSAELKLTALLSINREFDLCLDADLRVFSPLRTVAAIFFPLGFWPRTDFADLHRHWHYVAGNQSHTRALACRSAGVVCSEPALWSLCRWRRSIGPAPSLCKASFHGGFPSLTPSWGSRL